MTHPAPPGRPLSDSERGRLRNLTVRVYDDQRAALDSIADREGLAGPSDVVRWLIDAGVGRRWPRRVIVTED